MKGTKLNMSSKTAYIATAVFGLCLLFLHYYYNAHEANTEIEKGDIDIELKISIFNK